MAGPGPLDDWGKWDTPTLPRRSAPRPDGPVLPERPGRGAVEPPARWNESATRTQPLGRPAGPTGARVAPRRGGPARPPRRRRRWVLYTVLAIALVAVVAGGLALRGVYALGQAISSKSPLSTQTFYMLAGQLVNVLVLGYGGGAHDGANLTDSLMVVSLLPRSGSTTLISVPRDLWVQVPPDTGQLAKINTAYQEGLANGYAGLPPGRDAGAALAARKVRDVIGLDVPYWVTMDFTGFRTLVDALGGVDITVPTAFTAQYPRNDDPSVDASWKTIHFSTGRQHMDGERAIEYARARYVLDPPSEGSDFARSARQQLLVRAILGRARQPSELPRLTSATQALQGDPYSNPPLAGLAALGDKLDFTHAHRVGLTNQNVLVNAQSDDGQDILLPANGDWGAVQHYVAHHLAQ